MTSRPPARQAAQILSVAPKGCIRMRWVQRAQHAQQAAAVRPAAAQAASHLLTTTLSQTSDRSARQRAQHASDRRGAELLQRLIQQDRLLASSSNPTTDSE